MPGSPLSSVFCTIGRESLACDLDEPLRPLVDRFVHGLFRSGKLEAAHFGSVQGACLLGKAGRAHFYEAWAGQAADRRRECSTEVAALCQRLEPTAANA